MDLVLYIAALLFVGLGLLGAIFPGIPGPALSFVGLVVAYFSSLPPVSRGSLLIYLLLCVVVSALDYFLPAFFARKFGASRSGSRGATIGMLLGFVVFPPLGIILCPLFGAVLGEMLNDRTNTERAFRVGFGTFLAFVVGTGIKFIYALWILWLLVTDVVPVVWAFVESLFAK